jgi:hypothetical protein
MKKILITSLMIFVLGSCQTLAEIGFAGTGAAIGSFGGPEGAFLGGAGGVMLADTLFPEDVPHATADIAASQPQGTTASTLHEAHELLTGAGWWYLCLFVLIPFLTKKGRSWMANFTKLHNAVSKKDVDHQTERLNRIEETLNGDLKK